MGLDVFNDVRVENLNIFQFSMFFGIDFSQCGTNIPTPPTGIPCRRAPLPGSWDHLSDIGGTHLHLKFKEFKEFKESTCISNQTIISMCQRPESDFTEGRMPDVSDVSGVSLDLRLFESKDDCRSFFEHTANNL